MNIRIHVNFVITIFHASNVDRTIYFFHQNSSKRATMIQLDLHILVPYLLRTLFAECRMAGTANDYIGTLSTTRSGRTCAKWLSDYDLEQMQKPNLSSTTSVPSETASSARVKRSLMEQNVSLESSVFTKSPLRPLSKLSTRTRYKAVKPVHSVDRAYWNDSLYPERSVRNASNYCRDPSRNIAGTWCYTTDPLVPQDLCDVRDCEKPGKAYYSYIQCAQRRIHVDCIDTGKHCNLIIYQA